MKDFAKSYSIQGEKFTIHHSYTAHPLSEDFKLHKHQTYEIFLFLQGKAHFQVEGNRYKMSANDILIVNYNETHVLHVDENYPYERIVLELTDAVADPFCDNEVDFFSAINNRSLGVGNLIPAATVKQYRLDDYLYRIFDLCKEGGRENEIAARCVTIELLLAIKRAIPLVAPRSSNGNQKVDAVLEYINANLDKDLSLDSLSKMFYISKYHLCHIFKDYTNFSISQYISMKRVIHAHALIAAGSSTTDACFQSGFNDYSSFYKAYKKHLQETPQHFKQRNKKTDK